jgi:hypothetical protein
MFAPLTMSTGTSYRLWLGQTLCWMSLVEPGICSALRRIPCAEWISQDDGPRGKGVTLSASTFHPPLRVVHLASRSRGPEPTERIALCWMVERCDADAGAREIPDVLPPKPTSPGDAGARPLAIVSCILTGQSAAIPYRGENQARVDATSTTRRKTPTRKTRTGKEPPT